MSINFLNWAIGAIVASITFLSPMSVSNHARTNEVVEEAELKGCATNFENQGLIPFYYDGPDYSKSAVENPSNWKHGSDPETECDEQDQIACGLLVDPSFVDHTNPSNLELRSSINITAEVYDQQLNLSYVESIAVAAGEIYNKSM